MSNVPSPPRLALISDYCAHYARVTPEAEAAYSEGRSWSYAALADDVHRLAVAMVASGVEPGDRVATLAAPGIDFLRLFLATVSIGGIWLGLNPRYRQDELAYVLGDAQPKLVFSVTRLGDRDYSADLGALQLCPGASHKTVVLDDHITVPGGQALDAFLDLGATVPDSLLAEHRAELEPNMAALLVYTSGSTGQPKGALISHHGLVSCALNQLRYWPASPPRVVNFLPINHIGCVGDISCYALVSGGANLLMARFDPEQSLRYMQDHRATVWAGVPTTLKMCVDHANFSRYDLSALQLICWSGAAASAELVMQLRQVTPRLSTSYGMTETVGSVTYTEVGAAPEVLAETVGQAASICQLRIVDDRGRPVDAGEAGELQVKGDFLMLGYWNRAADTEAVFADDGWLKTGDLARQRSDGMLQIVGRLHEMFKSGGYNVYPREIEIVLESHPGVAQVAVVGVPDPVYQEVGRAFVVCHQGHDRDEAALRAWCREKLANYKIPKKFLFMDSLPTLPVGKVDKARLREPGRAQH